MERLAQRPQSFSNQDHFVCVQSVTVDPQGFLWVLDPAAPGNEFNLDAGPKLVKIDLDTDTVVKTIPFGRDVVPQGSYANDVRISPDGRTAYLTDSGIKGALLVTDIPTGRTRRLLDGHPSTQVDPRVTVHTDGQPLKRPDGRGPTFAADGIALDPAGAYLYWQALTGNTLYRIPTTALRPGLTPARVAAAVETLGTTCVADGYWMDAKGRLWITSPEDRQREAPPTRRHAEDRGARQTPPLARQHGRRPRRLPLRHRIAYPGHGPVPRERVHPHRPLHPLALQTLMHITITDTITPATQALISDSLQDFNTEAAGYADKRDLAVLIQDPVTNETLGGALGRTTYGLLFLDLFHLPKTLRGQGLGTKVLQTFEDEGRRRGCRTAMLYTISFQAPAFYERMGWRRFGEIPCEPTGTSRIFMTKEL